LDHDNEWYDNLRGGCQADCRSLSEVRMLYGLHDPAILSSRADEIVQSVFTLFQKPIDETILKEEFIELLESGGDLPDCEFDGHHGDDEWEVSPSHPSL
jgi:hypothetical protein